MSSIKHRTITNVSYKKAEQNTTVPPAGFCFSRCIPKALQLHHHGFSFPRCILFGDEKERRYVGPILAIRLQSAQVPTAGQISFTIQETGKVASCVVLEVICSLVKVIDALTIQSQKRKRQAVYFL